MTSDIKDKVIKIIIIDIHINFKSDMIRTE